MVKKYQSIISKLYWIGFFVYLDLKKNSDKNGFLYKVESDIIKKHHHTHTKIKRLDSGDHVYQTVVQLENVGVFNNTSLDVDFFYPERLHISRWQKG